MTAPFYSEKIKYFKKNIVGNDYVIGDIHGRYDLVNKVLNKVGFNIHNDRLFCVGDLIDRGAYSHQVFDFLSQPYVYAIRGNHEDILLEIYAQDKQPTEELLAFYGHQVGLEWWLEVNEQRKIEILNQLKNLPIVAEIDSVRGKIGLVHADVPAKLNWNEFKEEVLKENDKVITEAMWGRTRLSYGMQKDIEGIGRVYVGHTVQEKIKKYGNVIALDTGAVFNRHLTLVNMSCQTKFIDNAQQPLSDIHVINPEDKSILPFGSSYMIT